MAFLNINCQMLLLNTGERLPVPADSLIFFGIFIIAIGLASIIYPQLFWYLRIGRKVPRVAPMRSYLILLRIGGLLAMTLGIYMLNYCGLFGC